MTAIGSESCIFKKNSEMNTNEIAPEGRFTEAQLDLLRLFSRNIPDESWKEIRQIISAYFLSKATEEMDKLMEEKEWGVKKLEEWKEEHMRTPYKK